MSPKLFRKRSNYQDSPRDRQCRVSEVWLNLHAIPVNFQYLFARVKTLPLGRAGNTFLVWKHVAFPHFCKHTCSVASVVSDSVWPHGLQPARVLCPWGFSRQEHWGGLPCPPPGDPPGPGIRPMSLMSPALVGEFFTTSAPWAALLHTYSTPDEHFHSFPAEASHPVRVAHISFNHMTAKPYFSLFFCASSFSHEFAEVLACSGNCSLSWSVVYCDSYSFK